LFGESIANIILGPGDFSRADPSQTPPDYGVIVKPTEAVLKEGELATSTWTVPGDAIADAGTAAVTVFALTKVVGSAEPLNSTTEDELKKEPPTVSVKPGPPAFALLGEMELMTIVDTRNGEIFDLTSGGLTTLTWRNCGACRKEAGTGAVNCVELTNVVGNGLAFISTTELEANPVPFTVSVKSGLPAWTDSGLSVVMNGVVGPGIDGLPPQPANDATEMSPATARATAYL
jgi:hypothetical protein